ncbi:bromodomain-containing protein 8-like [Discoglossus pictus]
MFVKELPEMPMGHEMQFKAGTDLEKLFSSHTTSLSDFWDTCPDEEGGNWGESCEAEQVGGNRLLAAGTRGLNAWRAFGAQLHAMKHSSSGKELPQGFYQNNEPYVSTVVLGQEYYRPLRQSSWEADKGSPVIIHDSGFSICDPLLQCQRVDDSGQGSPASLVLLHSSTQEPPHNLLILKKMLTPIWKMIASHRFAGPFIKPVSDRQAPGYKDVVKRPMDLTTVKRGLSKGRIKTPAEFQRDVMLMLQNAIMYNGSDHQVYHKALEMQRDVVELLKVRGEVLVSDIRKLYFVNTSQRIIPLIK